MSRDFLIWGSSGHARVLRDVLALSESRIVALVDNDPNAVSITEGIPLLLGIKGLVDWISKQGSTPSQYSAALAIGGARGRDRLTIAAELSSLGIGLPTLIHKDASISSTVRIGSGSQILARTVLAADVRLGNQVIVNNSASVDHECQIGDGTHVAPGAVLCGCVRVGENVFIGAGAVVMPRISIGDNAMIGAGSVVTKNVEASQTVLGVPAKQRQNRT